MEITLLEAIKRLKDTDKSNLYVDIEEIQPGKYKLPFVIMPVTVGKQSEGKLYENLSEGKHGRRDSLVILAAENIAIAATTVTYCTPFNTKGYKHIMVSILNPVWVTNPTGLTLRFYFTVDSSQYHLLIDVGGNAIVQTVPVTDGTTTVFILKDPTAGVPMGLFPANLDNYKMRLSFTPVGTAESKNLELIIYGVE